VSNRQNGEHHRIPGPDMDARRLTAPLVAAGLLRRRPAAPLPAAVRDTVADARERLLRVPSAHGALELRLLLPSGAGPHPALVLAGGEAALAGALAGAGIAVVQLSADSGGELIAAVAGALTGRIDINPHEIGVAAGEVAPPASPHLAFIVQRDSPDLAGRVLARVTTPA
jgi:hypothetical protein